jgi:ketosteroid isomerase-like protein
MNTTTTIDNATVVASLYEAFGRADIPFILSHIDDACKWIGAGENFLPQGGTYNGKEVVNFFMKLNDAVEFKSFNTVSIHNIGENEVVAFGNMSGAARNTGKISSSDWVMHWKFNDDGKVVYYQDFHNTAAEYAAMQP